ncbi:MAG TPA: bifunctional nuclease family protein [Thermodesulfobacteriota bacterium]|nr:bifunctional nuclease family protein [Thermodesulfobacteriota bacterium]
MVEMKVHGLFFDSETNQSVVVLKEEATGKTLPIWVGLFEANAITMGIEHTWTPRPMTHDLLKNIIEGMDATVRDITVTELKSNTFYAVISLDVGGKTVKIDSRPSDAIALALRTSSPIFVDEKVLDSAGHTDTKDKEKGKEKEKTKEVSDKWIDDLFDKLKPEDFKSEM